MNVDRDRDDMMHKIGGIIFDLDGTLLDTLGDLAHAMNTVLQRHQLASHPVDAYRYFVGDGVDMLVRRASGIHSDTAYVNKLVDEFSNEYLLHRDETTKPYVGIMELMEDLGDRRLPVAVLSNKPHEMTVEMVRHYFCAFNFIALIGEGIFPKKPDPEAAFYIASVMGIEPARCLYVGDTGTDMKTAIGAGMPSAGVLWGFRDAAELQENSARWLIHQPTQILDILDS